MNNEVKILEMLEQMNNRMNALESDIRNIKTDIGLIKVNQIEHTELQ